MKGGGVIGDGRDKNPKAQALDLHKLEETTRKEMLKKFELVKRYGADVTG